MVVKIKKKGQFQELEGQNKKRKFTPKPRYMGRVIKWNTKQGYGFVRCFDDGAKYYCNRKMIQSGEESLEYGTIVNFEIWNGHDREGNENQFVANLLVVEVPEKRR